MSAFDNNFFEDLAADVKKIKADLAEIKQTRFEPLFKEWLSHEEACDLLKIKSRTLFLYRQKKMIPYSYVRKNGKAYYRYEDIIKLFQKNYISDRNEK